MDVSRATHRPTASPLLRVAFAAALLSGLACQGCASALLSQQVRHQPRFSRPDEARSVQGSYLGLAQVEGRWHYAFLFPDFVWTGSRVRRDAVVLVPASPGPGAAVLVGGEAAEVRRELAKATADPAAAEELWRRLGQPSDALPRATAQVRPRRAARAASPLAGTPSAAEYPAVLEFTVGSGGKVEAVRVGWGTEGGLDWADRREVADHLKKPSWGERAARPLLSLGYLVTIPVDVVTLPAQVAGALLLVLAFSLG